MRRNWSAGRLSGLSTALGYAAIGLLLSVAAPAGEPPTAEKFRALMDAGNYKEAEGAAREILAGAEAREGPDSLAAAAALDLVVESLNSLGRSGDPTTKDLAARALATKEGRLEGKDVRIAVSLRNLGIVLWKTGTYAEARPRLDRALALREEALGPDHPEVGQSVWDLGNLVRSMGDFAGAKAFLERSLAIRERAFGPEHPDVAASLNSLGTLYWGIGDYAEARQYLERALLIFEKTRGPQHPMVAVVASNLAIVLGETGDLASARVYFERSLAIREKMLGPDHPDVGMGVNNLGVLYMHLSDYDRARPLFERALRIREKALGPDHPDVAQQGLNNLAWVLIRQGDREAARPLIDRALAALEKALGPFHPSVAETLGRLSILMTEDGDLEGALAVVRRTRAIREQTLAPTHPYLTLTIEEQARLQARLGDRAGALVSALQAENSSREHVRLTALTLSERQALRLAATRASGLDVALSLAAGGLEPASLRKVWDALIRSRALVLDEMAARHRTVGRTGSPEVAALAERLSASRARLANLIVRGAGPEGIERHLALLDEARLEKEGLERDLALKSAVFRREHERGLAGLEDVARSLPPGSALLAYAQYQQVATAGPVAAGQQKDVRSYLALVLRADREDPRVVPLGPADAIDDRVARWRQEVSREPPLVPAAGKAAEDRSRPAGARLRAAIWDPVDGMLDGVRQVFIVPDGALHLAALAALPGAEAGYLIESGPILHYLSAERDLVRPATETTGRGVLVVGNPDFESPPDDAGGADVLRIVRSGVSTGTDQDLEPYRGPAASCDVLRVERWQALPGSRREADEIAALWRRRSAGGKDGKDMVLALSGRRAAESLFKRAASGRQVIHLATHGFVVQDRCQSVLDTPASGPGDRSVAAAGLPPLVGDNPLLLSGLVLAGANRRLDRERPDESEDGILTAEEIASLDLSGVEWVVLSACETGVGRTQSGEGVLGLRRAFEIAGAETLIMTLWRVKDETARAWSLHLYENRLRGGSTAEAARRASLRIIEERRREGRDAHPFHWAAFVAAGDWR